ncbi:MAG TPA: hypothetical protein VGJ18_18755 [Gemmatimonadaceae bacterium]|jgi:hypothetical protein
MMKKPLSAGEVEAVNNLRERLIAMLGFFENAQEFRSAPRFRALVEETAARGSLRAMRLLAREIDDMANALHPHEREGLEAMLRSRFAIDKETERAELRRRVALVLKRGTIASETERRHLEDYAEMLESIGEDQSELRAVRSLLDRS